MSPLSNRAGMKRSLRNRKQQTRLQFTPIPSPSPDKLAYNSAVHDRLANVRYEGSSPLRQSSRPSKRTLPTPEPSSQLRDPEGESSPLSSLPSSPLVAEAPIELVDEDEDDELVPSSKRRRTTRHPTEEAAPTSSRKSLRLRRGASSPVRPVSSSSSSEFSHLEVIRQTSTKQPAVGPSRLSSSEISDDDAALTLVTQPSQRRRRVHVIRSFEANRGHDRARAVKGARPDDWLVDDDQVEYLTTDSEDVPSGACRRKQQPSNEGHTHPRTPKRGRHQEQAELEADLEDLQDSDTENATRKSRTRGGPVTTERDKTREHFELLKRRRAGQKIPRVHDSDDASDHTQDIEFIGAPADDIAGDDYAQYESGDESALEQDHVSIEDDDDFIEHDEVDQRGRPHPDLPIEFTDFAKKKPKELFPHIVEWMVKNKLSPAFNRDDQLYRLAFSRITDQVSAQAGSRLISSAWNAEFRWTILARPELTIGVMPGFAEDHIRTCDACNKTNRPASYEVVLSGTPYFEETLELIDNSDEDEDLDDVSRDGKGHELAAQDRHFYLGSHCAANAQMGHKLTHWKYHLNQEILAYLDEQDVLSAEAIVAREKLSKKKREKEAETIVDSMEQTGKIAELWSEFQNDMDDARLGMEDFQKKGGRSKGLLGAIRSKGSDGRLHEWRDDKYKQTMDVESDSN